MVAQDIAMILLIGATIGVCGFWLGDRTGFTRGRRVGWYERSRVMQIDPRHPIFFDPEKNEPARPHVRLLKDGTND